MKINVVTLCSGYGAQEMALDRLKRDYPEFDWELSAWAEIEPNAIKAHQACHPEYADRNIGDMTVCDYSKITQPVDLLIYSTPCQSVSVAGQNKGMEEGSDAASALIWHTRRAIETLKPKVCVLENVRGMIMGKNVKEFHKWQNVMESYGYTNFAKVLNSKDYGVPQNRERLFMISILDCTKSYHFPEPFKLEKRIKDILEPYGTVDESFYFSPEQLLRIIANTNKSDAKMQEGISIHPLNRKKEFLGFKMINGSVSPSLTAHDKFNGAPCLWQRLSIYADNAQAGRVYDVEGISPCIDTCGGGNRMPKILEPCILTPQRTEEAKELRRKGIEVFGHRELVLREDGICNTITTVTKDYLLQEPAIIQRPHGFNDGGLFSDVSPTVTTSSWDNNNLLKEPCILGYTRDKKGKVVDYHDKNVANTVHTLTGGGWNTDQFVKEPVAVRMIGRNPNKPSDRSKGCPTKQTLEFGNGVSNCITTVQKDSMVAEPHPLSFANLPDKTVLKDEDGRGYLWLDGSLWRVRKLVPIEVFRLQDVSDEDAKKIIAVCSKTACYALAGNSITCSVIYHCFRKLWIDTENESAQKSLFDF